MKRYVLTLSAKKDVNDVWDYIASDNVEAADRVLDALESAMVRLAKDPDIGHWRAELADKRHRFWLVYSYLIVYRHETAETLEPSTAILVTAGLLALGLIVRKRVASQRCSA